MTDASVPSNTEQGGGTTLMERMCTRKIRFEVQEHAEKALQKMLKKRGGFARTYECRYCDGWHITSQRGPDDPKPDSRGRGQPCTCTRETRVFTRDNGETFTANPIVKHNPYCLCHGKRT